MPAATGTTGPSGWAVNSNVVTTPKLPPPPRSAQNRSGFSVSLARRSCPSAVTIPTQRQPGDAGGGDNATGNRQPEGLRLAVDIPPGRPTLHAHSPSAGIDPHATHRRQIQHQPVIADAVTGDAMPPGAHRRQQLLLAGQVDRVDDVGGARALHDQARTAIHPPILDNTRLLIAVILGRQQPTPEGHPKLGKLLIGQLGGLARNSPQPKRHVPPRARRNSFDCLGSLLLRPRIVKYPPPTASEEQPSRTPRPSSFQLYPPRAGCWVCCAATSSSRPAG